MIFWDVHRQYLELGINDGYQNLTRLESARVRFLVSEELGWGDAGIAISFGAGGFPSNLAVASGRADLIERFPASELGCWAITEPDHGSDMIDVDAAAGGALAARGLANCVVKAVGSEFVINGQKSAWVSNGTIASAAALFTAVENADGASGQAVFLVPPDLPGVYRGKPTDKIGQRALNQGEIFFDNVRVPPNYTHLRY